MLSEYASFVDMYLKSDKNDWIDHCLQINPRQQHVKVQVFAKVVFELV